MSDIFMSQRSYASSVHTSLLQTVCAYVVATPQACPYDVYLVTEADSKSLMKSNKFLAETVGKVVVVNIKDIYLTVSHMALLVLTGTLLLFVTVVVLKFYIVKCKNMLTSALGSLKHNRPVVV